MILDNMENLWAEQVTIPINSSKAPAVMTSGHALVAIVMPAAWTAAKIGYEASIDNQTFNTIYDKAGGYEQSTAEASAFIVFPSADTIFAPFLTLKSVDANNAAVNQDAARTLTLIFRRFLGGA